MLKKLYEIKHFIIFNNVVKIKICVRPGIVKINTDVAEGIQISFIFFTTSTTTKQNDVKLCEM